MNSYCFNQTIQIGQRKVGAGQPCYVIAEAGVNHNGDIELAKKLIEVAARAGADAVKFQLFNTSALILPNVAQADYQKQQTVSQTQYQMLQQLELKIEHFKALQAYCHHHNITFLITPFDEVSLAELSQLNLAALKISSTDLTNLPFLRRAAMLNIPLILSSGMSELSEVELALDTLHPLTANILLLQCTSSYPAPENQIDLRVMQRYQQQYGVLAGYSDHTPGLGVAPYAVAAGAVLIEKHFTLDKTLPGPDHKASLDPDELSALIKEVRRVDTMLGRHIKTVQLCEQQNRQSLQKCLVARQSIRAGELLGEHNLVAMRTGGKGISPIFADRVFNSLAKTDYQAGDIIDA